jgi:lysozyme
VRINDQARRILETFTVFWPEARTDPRGRLTVGLGHRGERPDDVKLGMRLTKHQAEVIFEYDLQRLEAAIERLAPHANANQFSALVSLCFDIGIDALAKLPLLNLLNEARPRAAAAQFAKLCNVGHLVLPDLVKRRAAEAALFLAPVN